MRPFLALLVLPLFGALCSCSVPSSTASRSSVADHPAFGETVAAINPSCWVVFQDASGNYWFGSDGQGVCRYDGTTITRFTTKDGLCNDQIRGIQQYGPSGDLIITTLGGVSRFDGTRFTTLPVVEMASAGEGWALDPNDLWLPYQPHQRGPYRYDGTTLRHLVFPRSPRQDAYDASSPNKAWSPYEVYCTYRDRRGTVWFGTANLGICRYDGATWSWMYEAQLTELPNDAMFGIRSIIEDRDGAFWFCNTQYRYHITPSDGSPAIVYTREKGVDLSSLSRTEPVFFQGVVADQDGNLWMATYGEGVWRYDGHAITHFPIVEDGAVVLLFTIAKDRGGRLWLASHEHGPYLFDGERFVRFTPATGVR